MSVASSRAHRHSRHHEKKSINNRVQGDAEKPGGGREIEEERDIYMERERERDRERVGK